MPEMTFTRLIQVATTGLGLCGGLEAQTPGADLPPMTEAMTLAEAFALAPQANFNLLRQQENVAAREAQQTRARADLLPEFDLSVSQARQRVPNIGALEDVEIPGFGTLSFADSNVTDRFDALVRGSLSLFDANRWADFSLARFETRIARLQVDDAAQDVLQGIAEAFLAHQREVAQLAVVEAAIARSRVLLETAQQRFAAGAGTVLDVTRAEVQLAGDELSRLRQDATVIESALTFEQLLNLPLDGELALAPVALVETNPAPASPGLIAQLMERRPDALVAQKTLERNDLARRAARWERLPDLTLSGTWGYASEAWADDPQEQWSIQLGLEAPLFDGFRIAANRREAESAVRDARLVLAELRLDVEADYRIAVVNLRARWQEVQVADQQVRLAAQELELEENRFAEGIGDNNLVVDAQANLAAAEGALVDAEFQYQLTRLTLARVRGAVREFLP